MISTTTLTTVKKRLTEAYVAVSGHASVSTTTIERAIRVVSERFESLKVTLGWSHTETLTTLREISRLYIKLKTEESRTKVKNLLLEATVEIIIKEQRSKTLHDAAKTVAGIFVDCGMSERALEILQEIRLHLVAGISVSKDKSISKVDKSVSKVSYVFLVTFEQIIRGQGTVSYSELMADLLTETILYESYTRSLKTGTDTQAILKHAAHLRAFLITHDRRKQIDILQNQTFEIFSKKWGSSTKARHEISFLFFIGLLEEIGGTTREVQLGNIACVSSITKVRFSLEKNHTQEAYELALCALNFINHERAYHQLQNVGYGFKLSALMAGRGLGKPAHTNVEPKLRENMLQLSRNIIREVLQACKDSNINFVRLQLRELNDLVGLLGEQQNYADLEVSLYQILIHSHTVTKNVSFSGFSTSFGHPVKSKKLGPRTPSSPSAAVSSKPAF